jgi:hypothetical protein
VLVLVVVLVVEAVLLLSLVERSMLVLVDVAVLPLSLVELFDASDTSPTVVERSVFVVEAVLLVFDVLPPL